MVQFDSLCPRMKPLRVTSIFNIFLNSSIDVYHVEQARVDAEEKVQNKNTRIEGLHGLVLSAYI